MFIKDGEVYSLRKLSADNPDVSFPQNPSIDLLASYGVFVVVKSEPPLFNPKTESLAEGFTEAVDGWKHSWAVVPHSLEKITAMDDARSLDPVQFKWLLAFTGLEDVWGGLLSATKGSSPGTYAMLKAQLEQPQFRLGKTLGMIEQLSDLIAQTSPDADMSEATIRTAWAKAEQVSM